MNNTDIPPSIFYFNEEKENMEEIKDNHNFEINYNNFESKLIEGKANFDILFKFFKNGHYLIKLDIKYIILHEEVDTKLEFNYSKNFYFRVINPLSMSYNIVSNNFLLSDIFFFFGTELLILGLTFFVISSNIKNNALYSKWAPCS